MFYSIHIVMIFVVWFYISIGLQWIGSFHFFCILLSYDNIFYIIHRLSYTTFYFCCILLTIQPLMICVSNVNDNVKRQETFLNKARLIDLELLSCVFLLLSSFRMKCFKHFWRWTKLVFYKKWPRIYERVFVSPCDCSGELK